MRVDHAVSFDELVDYAIGEVPPNRERVIDEHLFGCDDCAADLAWLLQMAGAVAGVVEDGRVGVAGTRDLVEQLRHRGVAVREYTVGPGETVRCTAGPDDAFVAIVLAELPPRIDEVTVHIEVDEIETGTRREPPAVVLPIDAPNRQAVVLYPGRLIQAYPRSRWTMRASAATEWGTTELATYVLDHTPWERLSPADRRQV